MIARDLRMLARRRRTYVLRGLFAGGLVLTALLAWWADGPGRVSRSSQALALTILKLVLATGAAGLLVYVGKIRSRKLKLAFQLGGVVALLGLFAWLTTGTVDNWDLDRMARFGTQMFVALSVVGAVLCALLAPAFTAGAVAQEKERGTLALLQTTQLGGPEIVFGKVAGRVLVLYLLIAAGLPVLASCMLFGGVGPLHVCLMSLNLFAIATLCASVGFLLSVVCHRTHQALMASYLILTGYAILCPVVLMLLFRRSDGWELSRFLDPAVGFIYFIGRVEGVRRNPGAGIAWKGATDCLPFCIVVSLLCLLAAKRLFPIYATREPTYLWRRLFQRVDAFFNRLNKGLWRVDFRSDRLEGNPVAWKERHFRLLGKTDYLIRIGYLIGVCLGVLYAFMTMAWPGMWWENEFHMVMLGIMAPVLFLIVSVLASSSIAVERDRSSWDLLLTTTLTGKQILWGKISGTLRSCFLFLLFPLAHMAIACLAGEFGIWLVLAGILVLVAGVLVQLCVGTYFSIRSGSALNAFLWTFGIGLAVNLLVPGIICSLVREEEPFFLSPTAAMLAVAHASGRRGHLDEEATIGLVACLCYAGVSIGFLSWMSARFDRLVGRSWGGWRHIEEVESFSRYVKRSGCALGLILLIVYPLLSLVSALGRIRGTDYHVFALGTAAALAFLAIACCVSICVPSGSDRSAWQKLFQETRTAWGALWGRSKAALRIAAPFLVFPFLHLVVVFADGRWRGSMLESAAVILFGGALLQLAISARFAVSFSRVVPGLLCALCVGLFIHLIVPVGLAILVEIDVPLMLSPTIGFARTAFHWHRHSLYDYHVATALTASIIYIFTACWLLSGVVRRVEEMRRDLSQDGL